MIEQTLQIHCTRQAIHAPRAVLIPTGDPATWVAEVTRWRVNQKSLRFLPLPTSATDLSPAAVLVIVKELAVDNDRDKLGIGQQCLPYGRIANHLYLPTEAESEPAISDAELGQLLSDSYRYVWHPAVGLIAFEADEVLSLADLIARPTFADADWSRAEPGIRFASKIISLEAAASASLDGLFGAESKEIGSEGQSWQELPPSDKEPSNDPLSNALRQGGKFLAGMVGSFGSAAEKLAGKTPGGSAWYERMQEWAKQQMAGIDSALQRQRNKEVNRLLDLLESNPDEGLKYALPMDSGGSRGFTPPGGSLGRRNTDFNLGGLGGGAADHWSLDYQYQQRLIQQYHELANRELRLGRYRRAAYIYAHLLNDFTAAANALTTGGHYREAAVLYRDKLGRPLDAAECLEKGGLWSEAIDLYDDQQQYEKVGDLYRHLEQEEEAAAAYEKAIGQCRSRDDYLAAAVIYEEKLHDTDAALTNLHDAWPYSGQAAHCVRKIFEINAREGHHLATRRWIEDFRARSAPKHMRATEIKLATETAIGYPDAAIQHLAADTTRVLVAAELPTANRGEARELVASLRELVPQDRLLASDTRRYVDEWEAELPKQPVKPRATSDKVRLLRVIQLNSKGTKIQWMAAAWSDSTIYAAGYDAERHRLVLARCNWMGAVERHTAPWELEYSKAYWEGASLLMAVQPHHDHFVYLHRNSLPGGRPLPSWEVPRTDIFPNILRVGGIAGLSGNIWGAARTLGNRTWVVESAADSLRLVAANSEGRRMHTLPIPSELLDPSLARDRNMPIHANGEYTYLAARAKLITTTGDRIASVIEMDREIVSLATSAPNTLSRLAVGLDGGGEVIWPEHNGDPSKGTRIRFGDDLGPPLVGINRGGYLIATAGATTEVYRTHARKLTCVGKADHGRSPIAVLSAPQAKWFGVAFIDGTINVYKVD